MTEPMTEQTTQPTSLWQLKPWWCQPWSIILTGITLPTVAWLVTHRPWLTAPIATGILLWWFVFLYLVPQQYAAMLAEMNTDTKPEN